MNAIAVTHNQLRSIATLTNAASKDALTPVITSVQVRTEGGDIIATATDRYRVADLTIRAVDDAAAWHTGEEHTAGGFSVLIPADMLTKAVRSLPTRSTIHGATVAIIHDQERNTVTIRSIYDGFEQTASAVPGTYPAVARLFPEDTATMEPFTGAVALKPAYLAAIDKMRLPDYDKTQAWEMRTWAGADHNPRPRPVLFTIQQGDGNACLRYLVQPSLIK